MIEPKSIYMLFLISFIVKTFPYKPIGGVLKIKEDGKMKDEKRKIIMASIVTLLVLLSVFAVIPAGFITASASSPTPKASAPVGTVTLDPADGAFPGQIVYFTWTGVPTDLVAPVYVTVYMNGAAYSTGVATYDSDNGVLKGTFTMPNDEPGTVFDISFSYRDSANNYATETVTGYTTLNMGMMPASDAYNDESEYEQYRFETGNGVFNGNVEFDGWDLDSIHTYNGDGATYWDFNVSQVHIGTQTLEDSYLNPQNVTFHNSVDFEYPANFTNGTYSRGMGVNVTTIDEGNLKLSLPASDDIPTEFTLSADGSKITSITTTFYVNTTVSGTLVSFEFTGIYSAPITSLGTYTMPGHFVAIAPTTLNMEGQFSASYDILDFGYDGTNYYVNYTLSITFGGTSDDGVVWINNAQYKNENYLNDTSTTTVVNSTDTLTLFGTYDFYSKQVGAQNPGIYSTFVFNFENTTYGYEINNISFFFENYVNGAVDNGIPPVYLNQSISVQGFNVTLVGTINVTLTTNYYVPGVYDIAPVIWNFTMNMTFHAESADGKIVLNGSIVNPSSWGTLPSVEAEYFVFGQTGYGGNAYWFGEYMNSTLTTVFGYPRIDYVYEDARTLHFHYIGQDAMLVMEPVVIPVGHTVTPGDVAAHLSQSYGASRNITGLNETLYHGTGDNDTWIYITYLNMNAAIYGVSDSGMITIQYHVSDDAYNDNHLIHLFGSTVSNTDDIVVSEMVSTYNAQLSPQVSYALDLARYEWYLHSASFTGYLNVSFAGYVGTLNFSGAGENDAVEHQLYAGYSFDVPGVITGLEGFANNSMGGYFNATVYVYYTRASLYGGVFNGTYIIDANVMDILNNTGDYPFFDGYLKTTIYTALPSEDPISPGYTHHALVGDYYRSYMQITGMMRVVNITNGSIAGNVHMGWPVLGTTHDFEFTVDGVEMHGTPNIEYDHEWDADESHSDPGFNVTYSGTPVDEYEITVYYDLEVGAPIHNVSLIPVIDASMEVDVDIESGGYYSGHWTDNLAYYRVQAGYSYNSAPFLDETTLNLPTQDSAPVVINHDLFDEAVLYDAFMPHEHLTFQGNVGNISFSTDDVDVWNTGDYYITGTATSPNGMGTVTGVVHLNSHYPTTYYSYHTGNYYIDDNINATVTLNIHIENYDGTHTDITVSLPYAQAYVALPNYYSKAIHNVPYSMTTLVNEGSDEGTATFGSYTLEQGSGALVVNLSDDQVATIVTKLGDVVNVSMAQLDAKIVGLWNTANETYALLDTAYGEMKAELDAINATIVNVQNGIATIQTTLGDIQTSLSNLDAKITKLQGDVATIQTDLGTINVKLDAINATVVSNANGIDDLKGSVVDIKTTLGDIKGTVTDIKNGVATIQTDLGTMQTDVSDIKTTTADTSSGINTAIYWNIGVLVLVIITLILVAYVLAKVNKISQGKVEEETVEEETTEEETKEE